MSRFAAHDFIADIAEAFPDGFQMPLGMDNLEKFSGLIRKHKGRGRGRDDLDFPDGSIAKWDGDANTFKAVEPFTIDPNAPKRFGYCVLWTESEQGWGQRPDGYSLHLSLDSVKKMRADLTESRKGTSTPHEYDHPETGAYPCVIQEEDYQRLKLDIAGTGYIRRGGQPPEKAESFE